MTSHRPQKGKRMRTVASPREMSPAAKRLEELRMKAASRVHKTEGDPEEIRQEGLRVFQALELTRKRANKTCK
jgi:hypothetical protein